jgi:N-acetylglucosaminyldiphosphoundecaprenol N-acetyl-beta-D-mannosaminyltransferase
MKKRVLGVNIDDVSEEEALKVVESWLIKKDQIFSKRSDLYQPRLVFTPGPEFLVTAKNDPEFKKILNAGDLNIPDGYGLKLLGGITHQIAGVNFLLALCREAAQRGWTVGMIGNPNTRLAARKLAEKFPGLKMAFALDNPEADRVLDGLDTLRYVDILFVGVGHPKQEKFLAHCSLPIAHCPFRVGMGVGGSFDFISGRVWEPPGVFSHLGLKWLGRLVSRPGYMAPRIYRALVRYPLYIIEQHLLGHESRERS